MTAEAAFAVILIILIVYVYFYQYDSVAWMWGDEAASSGSSGSSGSSVGVSFTEDGTTLESFTNNRENFVETTKNPGGGGACEEKKVWNAEGTYAMVPADYSLDHELCKDMNKVGAGLRYVVYFGATSMDMETITKEKPAVVQEFINSSGKLTDVVYVTHYDDQTKVGKSAVADTVSLCKTITANMSNETKRQLTAGLEVIGDKIMIKKDVARDVNGGEAYTGTGEASMCPDGKNFCLPMVPGVNFPIMFAMMTVVIVSELRGESVDPYRVKFNVKIPEYSSYNVERVIEAYENIWKDYEV